MLHDVNHASATAKTGRFRRALLVLGAALVLALAIGGLFAAAHHKRERWQAFVREHDCKKVGHMAGDLVTSVGVDAKGMPVVSTGVTGSKTAWKCNDGVTYWR